MFDDHVLQYKQPGMSGECDLVVGLDFGTSTSKVVVQAPDLPGGQAYAVDFGDFAHSSMAYLLPARVWVTPNGTCTLPRKDAKREDAKREGAKWVNGIKLELFDHDDHDEHLKSACGPKQQGLQPEAVAVAYLALLLRYARKWFLKTKRDVIGHFQTLKWSVNLGVPSRCVEDNEENRRFRRVGRAAWMLSVLEENITIGKAQRELLYLSEAPEYWDRDDDDLTCDFDLIPEIAAGADGYARSPHRLDGVHLMIDVGASTVDVCGFLLHQRAGDHRYSLLTAEVQKLGTIRLYHERIRGMEGVHKRHAQGLRDRHLTS